jgi:hypothetical protein
VKRPWAVVVGVIIAGLALVPLATAGAEGPAPTAETPTAPEGSVPPGGTVNCTTAAAMDPDHGPPGTVVTVTATFAGNCDDVNPTFLAGMVCTGTYTAPNAEALPFSMTVDPQTGNATGTFTAPVSEPDPPVVDAVEPVIVQVTCTVPNGPVSPPAEGGVDTTYVYPSDVFDLELFADSDGEQPTLVDNDQVDNEVVEATPPFTG